MALSRKQTVFINEYLRDFNATQAAIRAGYSSRSAHAIGHENLTKPEIAEAIQERIAEKSMPADEVLLRLADMARGDMGDFVDITSMGYNLNLRKAQELGLTHLIKKIKQKTTTFLGKKADDEDREVHEVEIELYSAQEALALLGKHHKLFIDRRELTGLDGTPLIDMSALLVAMERVYGDASD